MATTTASQLGLRSGSHLTEAVPMSEARVPSPDYDPDSAEPQPPGSLAALIGRILTEIDELQFRSFSKDDALELGFLLVELGRQRNHPIAIDITKGEQVLFHAALEGATPDNERWI